MAAPRDGERFEPLPPIARLPAFVWRRLPRWRRFALVALLVAAAAGALLSAPGIRESKREADARERREAATRRAQRVRELSELVRPRAIRVVPDPGSGAPVRERVRARSRGVARLRGAIGRDATRRTGDRIRRTDCEGVGGASSRAAISELARSRVRLSCLAVTAEFAPSTVTTGGSIGYPYRALADFRSGRIAFCRVFGVPGEGGLTRRQAVTTPKACGG